MDKFLIKSVEQKQYEEELLNQINNANNIIFGNSHFRPLQQEVIIAAMDKQDIFVIMPTGGGKSLCYALPAILSCGVTIIISPLISLIEDQVSNFIQINNIGIPCAYLTSNCKKSMINAIYSDLSRVRKGYEPFLKLLYVTPERIVKDKFTRSLLLDLYNNENLARFVIDEAHCVSSWGHDFRKDYLKLDILKKEYPNVPITCLTATARPKVQSDIIKLLQLTNCKQYSSGFNRSNLYFQVIEKPSKLIDVYNMLIQYINTYHEKDDTGIIYCMTRQECVETAEILRKNGINADYYHAGQTKKDRKLVQGSWLSGKIKVVCATISYGMGIDKSDVRYVIHLSLAKSLEGYYQEAGRAGRDGLLSNCLLFYRETDIYHLKRIMTQPPKRKLSQRDVDMLQEMKNYCENTEDSCRKYYFHKIFTEDDLLKKNISFTSCGNMCDNCLKLKNQNLKIHLLLSTSLKSATSNTIKIPLQSANSLLKASKTKMHSFVQIEEDEEDDISEESMNQKKKKFMR